MDNQLKRLLNLVRRTGDRLVVTDPNGEDTYVLMGLEAYEKIATTAEPTDDFDPCECCGRDFEDDFTDDYYNKEDLGGLGSNSTISDEFLASELSSKNTQKKPFDFENKIAETRESSSWQTPKDIWETMKPATSQSETWNTEKFTPEEQKIIEDKFGIKQEEPDQNKFQAPLGASSDPKNSQAPSGALKEPELTPQKPEEEPSEEQFYLEPIE